MENSITYPIKAVSQITGLSIHVIRAWEKRYNAVVPFRTDTNRRLYTSKDVEKLKLLSAASNMGYSIGNIANYKIDDLKSIVGFEEHTKKVEEHTSKRTDSDNHSSHSYVENCV